MFDHYPYSSQDWNSEKLLSAPVSVGNVQNHHELMLALYILMTPRLVLSGPKLSPHWRQRRANTTSNRYLSSPLGSMREISWTEVRSKACTNVCTAECKSWEKSYSSYLYRRAYYWLRKSHDRASRQPHNQVRYSDQDDHKVRLRSVTGGGYT